MVMYEERSDVESLLEFGVWAWVGDVGARDDVLKIWYFGGHPRNIPVGPADVKRLVRAHVKLWCQPYNLHAFASRICAEVHLKDLGA